MPQKWGFSPICDPPRFFFKNRALSLLYPYGALTSCKKLEKSLERSLRYLKTDYGLRTTDGLRTDMGDYIGPLSGKPGVQNALRLPWNMFEFDESTLRSGSSGHTKAAIYNHPKLKFASLQEYSAYRSFYPSSIFFTANFISFMLQGLG